MFNSMLQTQRILNWLLVSLFVLIASACGPSNESVAASVKTSMSKELSTNPQWSKYNMTVESITVLPQSGNQYQGMANIRFDGSIHQVPVEVTATSDGVIWKTEPGAFLFVAQKELNNPSVP